MNGIKVCKDIKSGLLELRTVTTCRHKFKIRFYPSKSENPNYFYGLPLNGKHKNAFV